MKKIVFVLLALMLLVLAYPANSIAMSDDEYIEKSTELLSKLLDRTYEEFKNPRVLKTDDLALKNENTNMYLAHMEFYLNYLKVWNNHWRDYKYNLEFQKFEDGFVYFNRDIEYSEENSLFYSDEYDATYKIKIDNVNNTYLITHIESTGFMFDVFEMIYNEKLRDNPNLTVTEYLELRKIDSKKLAEDLKVLESKDNVLDLEKQHREYNKKMGLPEDAGLLKRKDKDLSYTDTIDHWAISHIEELTLEGYINGYPDNSFKPDNNITYGEFISLFNRMYIPGYKIDQRGEFWYSNDLLLGIKAGYLPKDFVSNGEKFIKRDEVAFLINRHLNSEENEELVEKFSDRSLIRYPKEVSALVKLGVLEGYPEGDFKPQEPIKRGEMVKILEALSRKYQTK